MKKFVKKVKEGMKVDRKISRKEKKRIVSLVKVDLLKLKIWIKKLDRANKRIGTLEGELKRDIGIIRTRLKMTRNQLGVLTSKKKFLLKELGSLRRHEKENRGKIKDGERDSRRLNKEMK